MLQIRHTPVLDDQRKRLRAWQERVRDPSLTLLQVVSDTLVLLALRSRSPGLSPWKSRADAGNLQSHSSCNWGCSNAATSWVFNVCRSSDVHRRLRSGACSVLSPTASGLWLFASAVPSGNTRPLSGRRQRRGRWRPYRSNFRQCRARCSNWRRLRRRPQRCTSSFGAQRGRLLLRIIPAVSEGSWGQTAQTLMGRSVLQRGSVLKSHSVTHRKA